jgi:putative transcriptional regulator
MSKLGKRLINATKSAQAIVEGEADPKTYRVHVPAHLDVRALRSKLKMRQNAFAARFGILPSTLRDWEQNRRRPDGAARVLLMVKGTGRGHPRACTCLTPKAHCLTPKAHSEKCRIGTPDAGLLHRASCACGYPEGAESPEASRCWQATDKGR